MASMRRMCIVSQTIVNRAVVMAMCLFWMFIEILRVEDNIEAMSACAECVDHWQLQQQSHVAALQKYCNDRRKPCDQRASL